MIVNDFKDATMIACRINSEDEFNKVKELLIKSSFEFDFEYEDYLCSIQIRLLTKTVTYGTGVINYNYKVWFLNILSSLVDKYDIFFVEYYKVLYRYFSPLNIHNYFDDKNVYEKNKIFTNYEIFNESLLNNSNDLLK